MWGYLDDERYGGLPGFATLPELAVNFPFGPNLPCATFPPDFVKCYADIANIDPVNYSDEVVFFLAHFADGPLLCMYDGLFSPQIIHSQNRIVFANESAGNRPHPPHHGHYAIGSAYEETNELRIVICLAESSAHYGKIYIWRMHWHKNGEAEITNGFGFVANSLREMFELLQTEKKTAALMLNLNKRS